MPEHRVPITRLTWARLGRAVSDFANCEVGWRARGLFALLIALLFAFNALNVLNSYVGRDFMTAISNRDSARFTQQAIAYLGVFAASALVGALYSFSEQRLGLLWREWLTRQLLGSYLERRAYYRLSAAGVLTSPDERIAEDVPAFTATTLSFVLMLCNATVTVVAFSGVLWSISRTLFAVAVLYAACGSALTVLFGRPLVWLNYNQLDKEADFRANLVHVQANAESTAHLGLGSLGEAMEHVRSPAAAHIDVHEDEARVAYEGLTLLSPGSDHVLVRELSVSVPRGTRVLIVGPNDAAKVALFRATAGIWENGSGRIVRPGLDAILFLPERPYLPPGTLRDVLVRTGQEGVIGDAQIAPLLHVLGLEPVLERTGGLDVERDWDDVLSLGEQQLLSVARVILAAPRFAFLERPRRALGSEEGDRILSLLWERSITYLTLGDGSDGLDDYDAVLELAGDGGWTWKSVEAGREGVEKSAERS